jgi:lipoate-protein ligase A
LDRWRLVTDWDASPEWNMGLDEALLDVGAAPTLRVYTWSPDTLSLGYFQKLADVPAAARAGAVVRRITGGGAIHHAGELTFSLTAPLDHPLYRGPVARSYERVHAAVIEALAVVGVRAALTGATPLVSDARGTGMCFHASTPLDVAWDGRKGVGSAQRRRGGRVLHHASIKLSGSELEGDVAVVPGGVAPADFAPHLVERLGQRFQLAFEPGEPTRDERARARALGTRYTSAAWVQRR